MNLYSKPFCLSNYSPPFLNIQTLWILTCFLLTMQEEIVKKKFYTNWHLDFISQAG